MTEYQKSDQMIIMSELLISVDSMQRKVIELEQTISSLHLDIDTMIKSLDIFHKKIIEHKRSILDEIAKVSAEVLEEYFKNLENKQKEIIDYRLEELIKQQSKSLSRKKKLWFLDR